jgi:cytochrome c oxidase subunit 4
MSDNAKTAGAAQHGEHITPRRVYLMVGLALYALTVITVAVTRFDFGPWNLVVAMGIASIKAVLVALFFMHLLHDNKLYAAMFSAALLFLGILIILTLFDTLGRGDIAAEERGPIQQRAVIYDEEGKPLKKAPGHGGEHEGEGEGDGGEAAGDTAAGGEHAGGESKGSGSADKSGGH